MRAQIKKLPEARENASNQEAIGFSFESDGLIKWCEFSGPITGDMKQNQSNLVLLSTLN